VAQPGAPATSQRFGQLASLLPDCASTQDIVRASAAAGAPEGFLAVTEFQSAGRGRQGRAWVAPPGQCLLASLLLRPHTPPERLAALNLVAGIAVAEALPVAARVRWPNDVVVGGAKVAGVIAELETLPGRAPTVALGIGINVNVPAAELPETDRLPATSLLVETGRELDRLQLLHEVIDRLQAAYREFEELGFRALLDRWAALDALAGHEVTLDLGASARSGTVLGVDANGRLLVRGDDGADHAYASGEIVRVQDV
jgi:BirA family transcriptional regulator, biotin operon repressor / biotin---[acetyl-CoA-carboxylase] ligase